MGTLKIKAGTALRLGVANLWRAALYRLGLKTGINSVRRLHAVIPPGPYFSSARGISDERAVPRLGWYHHAEAFGKSLYVLEGPPPDWLKSCFSNKTVTGAERSWWEIPDFDPEVGDIKAVWELSRFDWVLACAQHAAKGEESALQRLNIWLADWLTVNPPYRGPNWKCGQEASIRVMHLAIAAKILGQINEGVRPGLLEIVELHLQRIAPTMLYAVAQDNNHGTSEASALFIGGSWLEANGRIGGDRFSSIGRKWLEERARRLVEKDGSFSQYSLNYHRVMLDSFTMVELWRRTLALPSFSQEFYTRSAAACEWLRYMTCSYNGDGPNQGANDGARLMPLTDTDYRDYRPSVQLAAALFQSARAYPGTGGWNQPLYWLGVPVPDKLLPVPRTAQFSDGGYFVLRQERALAMLRYPRFHFRPSQADALHVDFWLEGENWLRDAGSFSYNTDQYWLDYFPGTVAHNTVQFDDRDQMPRLSRFLYGAWLKARNVDAFSLDGAHGCSAGYKDWQGAEHNRRVVLSDQALRVEDKVKGFETKAVLRWRLKPGNWTLDVDARSIRADKLTLTISATRPIKRFEVMEGWESRYYLRKTPLPVLEVEIDRPGDFVTVVEWDEV